MIIPGILIAVLTFPASLFTSCRISCSVEFAGFPFMK